MNTIIIALILHLLSTQMLVVVSVAEELLQLNTNQTKIPPPALNISELLFTSNESTAPANISLGTNFDINCDMQRYDLINTPSDCEAAWQNGWPEDTVERTWVIRHQHRADPNAYALPVMTMGPEARCYFQLTLKSGRSISHTNLLELRTSSAALAQSCITNQRIAQGGIARSPGGDNNMDLIMTEYQPRVQCSGPGSFPSDITKISACALILETMEISTRPIVFGPSGDPATQFTTPFQFVTHDGQCSLIVDSSERTDSETWHKLWQEAQAIFARCLRKGKAGHSNGLGDRDRISLTMGKAEQYLASNFSMGTLMIA